MQFNINRERTWLEKFQEQRVVNNPDFFDNVSVNSEDIKVPDCKEDKELCERLARATKSRLMLRCNHMDRKHPFEVSAYCWEYDEHGIGRHGYHEVSTGHGNSYQEAYANFLEYFFKYFSGKKRWIFKCDPSVVSLPKVNSREELKIILDMRGY